MMLRPRNNWFKKGLPKVFFSSKRKSKEIKSKSGMRNCMKDFWNVPSNICPEDKIFLKTILVPGMFLAGVFYERRKQLRKRKSADE